MNSDLRKICQIDIPSNILCSMWLPPYIGDGTSFTGLMLSVSRYVFCCTTSYPVPVPAGYVVRGPVLRRFFLIYAGMDSRIIGILYLNNNIYPPSLYKVYIPVPNSKDIVLSIISLTSKYSPEIILPRRTDWEFICFCCLCFPMILIFYFEK